MVRMTILIVDKPTPGKLCGRSFWLSLGPNPKKSGSLAVSLSLSSDKLVSEMFLPLVVIPRTRSLRSGPCHPPD